MAKLGKAFSEGVFLLKKKHQLPQVRQLRGWGARLTLLYILLIFVTFALILRLFHLTVIKGKNNRQLSEGNRIQTTIIHAPRGIFFDRKGIPLVKNISGIRVSLPCEDKTFCRPEFINENDWKKQKNIYADVLYERDYLREYLYPEQMSQVLGYLSEITKEEIANPLYKYQGYLIGDHLGRMGLEASDEKNLRGVDGKELVEINAKGERLRTLGKVEALPGKDLTLSIDSDLQKVAYEAMGNYTGAIIVSKPKTGEILALVSTPSFDINKITRGLSAKEYQDLANNSNQPLFDRAISGVYPPGSTFKIIVATAGLESGKITQDTIFTDTGILKVGEFSFGNWYFNQYGRTEGNVDILKAIARSNDIFFYKLGETVGISEMAKWGKKFGIGQKLGIELNGEAEGLMPDPEWKKLVSGENWYLGNTYHIAIGQGDLQTTPLQVNAWTNVIAAKGMLCKPTLIKSADASLKESNNCTDLGIKKETINLITEGMKRACSSGEDSGYQGTGWPLFDFSITKESLAENSGKSEKIFVPIACKTGTAEFDSITGVEQKTHAWFTAFAPVPSYAKAAGGKPISNEIISGDPEIAVTVLVERGGEGSSVGGPIAKKIFEEWFKR